MITNLPFMRKITSSTLYCVLFTLLLSVSAFAQQPTITSVSPTVVSSKTPITITGTNLTGTTVKVGATTITPTSTTATAITFVGLPSSGVVTVSKTNFTSVNTASITLVSATSPTTYGATRIITDFAGYTDFTGSTGVANTSHNLLAFTAANGNVYSTGVNNTALSAHNVAPTPIQTVFKAFPVGFLPGNTGPATSSNYLVFGKAIDGNPSAGVITSPAIAGKTIKNVLSDGINGLDMGTGITNTEPPMIMEFKVASIDASKVSDTEPDILVSQIATGAAAADFYAFVDASGNIVGNPVSNNFTSAAARGSNSFDFFKFNSSTPLDTATPFELVAQSDSGRAMALASFRLSEFGITTANAASVAKFIVYPGGQMDPGFYSFNAGSISVTPVITTQPISQSVCTSSGANVTFTVVATGDGITYQWKKDGTNIPGATSASYTITNVATADLGAYTVVVTNIGGSVTSNVANLTSNTATATTWTGVTSSDWNTASNWTCNVVPSTTISASIPVVATTYPVLTSVTGICKDLIIASGASVTVSGSGILDITGAIINSGTLNAVDGTIAFLGTTAQNIPANAFQSNTIKNLIVNNAAGVTVQGATNLTGVLTLTTGTLTTGNQLTLKSNVNTTAMVAPVTGAVSGNMTIERYIPARRAFRFLSSPTTGGTIQSNWQEGVPTTDPVGFGTDITGTGGTTNGFDVSGSNNPSLFTFFNQNPATGTSWFAVTSTTAPLNAGVPYRILVRGDRTVNQSLNNSPATVTTLRTTGTIKTGDVVVTDLNQNASGFSLIGNPYQAPVDMAAVMTDASSLLNKNFYYVWDPTRNTKGAYVTVILPAGSNNFSGSVANKYLQPGQACFIQTATAGAPTLTFRESHKNIATATATIFKAEENPANMVFTLYDSTVLAANGVAADAFVVRFDENYTNEVDAFDAIKPTNQDENIGLMNSDKILSYESRALPVASDIIPISQTQYRTTSYVYKVAVNGLSNVNAYLLDKLTNTRTALVNDSETAVPFTVDTTVPESIAANRFDIVFENLLATSENTFENTLKIYPNPASDKFFVKLPAGTDGAVNVKLVNTLGQTVYSTTGTSENGIFKVQPKNTLQSGIYMVHVSNGKNTTTEKLIIK